jgi:dephospho-CoA kinase
VIGIAGRIGAGKTTAAKYLASAYGFRYLRYSQVLADEFVGPETKGALQKLGWSVMSGGLQGKLNAELIRRIRRDEDYAVDGLRHPTDFESLQRKFGHRFLLIYVDAPADLRYRRVKRHRHLKDVREFDKADKHPVESQTPRLRRKAHAVIRNNSTVAQLHRRIDQILDSVFKEPRS